MSDVLISKLSLIIGEDNHSEVWQSFDFRGQNLKKSLTAPEQQKEVITASMRQHLRRPGSSGSLSRDMKLRQANAGP